MEHRQPDSDRPWASTLPMPLLLGMASLGLTLAILLLLPTDIAFDSRSTTPETTQVATAASATPTLSPTVTQRPRTPTPTLTASPTALPTMTPLPTRTPTPRRTPTPTATATESPLSVLPPQKTLAQNAGRSGYQALEFSGLSAGGDVLRLHGTVRMPEPRYPDQSWRVQWASMSVIDDLGLEPTDGRIQWYDVDGTVHRQDAYEIVAQWQMPESASCRFWIRVVATSGDQSEQWYGQFDVQPLEIDCD